MKKLILFMLLLGFVSTGHSQIVLKEARVDYKPSSLKLDPYTNSLTLKIKEEKVGEFRQDPLMFVKNKFDMNSYVDANRSGNFRDYQVWFQTRKGYLMANYDKDGNLVSSSQKFKDVLLPQETRNEIIAQYGNVHIFSSKYFATSTGWNIDKEYYRVKIKDANNKTQKLRLQVPEKRLTLAGL
ncbi:MAG: hypothetical protein WBL27_02690 [Salinimicrobium sp.]